MVVALSRAIDCIGETVARPAPDTVMRGCPLTPAPGGALQEPNCNGLDIAH
jgi:hypothetical protein